MSLSVDIEKKLGSFTLSVQFETENERLALLGASGCGKSMTLKCIAGIVTPDRGKIVLNGVTLFDSDAHIDLTPQKRNVGYLFQQYALFPNMTVRQNIAVAVRDKVRRQAVTEEKLRQFRLEEIAGRKPGQISGGQQQQLAIGRALMSNPKMLILDEPTEGIQPNVVAEIAHILNRVRNEMGVTIVVVEQNYRFCRKVADRFIMMQKGKIVASGMKEDMSDDLVQKYLSV